MQFPVASRKLKRSRNFRRLRIRLIRKRLTSARGLHNPFGVKRRMSESSQADMPMSQRDANLLCLRDTLEHLSVTQQRLEWTEDEEAIYLLTENMIRDLARCQRLCESLRRRCSLERVA